MAAARPIVRLAFHYGADLNGVEKRYNSQPGISLFDDNNTYWSSVTPTASVQVPHTGTKIRILGFTDNGLNMTIRVGPTA
jgi:immune inhibitor A